MNEQILIVEDERIIACDIQNCLESYGYSVPAIASYGEDAIQQAGELLPDLILMDIMLKGEMNGIETAAAIYQKYQIPIIYLTAYSDENTLNQAKVSQPFGYILKPFEDSQLLTTIEIALAKHQNDSTMREELLQAREKNKLKSKFVSMVSHEIRNPLTTIMTSSEVIAKQLKETDNQAPCEYIQHIQAAVQQMSSLLNDVLLIGQSDVNKLKFNPAPIDIISFCRELVTSIKVSSQNSHHLVFTTQGEYEHFPNLDIKLLHHILINLLTNAVKYSPITSTIKFDVFCLQSEVIFRIQDEGIGIPEADQELLFNSFQRASNVGNIPGTGLGLSIVKKYVNLHGGDISLISKEGMGTTFIVSIPLN